MSTNNLSSIQNFFQPEVLITLDQSPISQREINHEIAKINQVFQETEAKSLESSESSNKLPNIISLLEATNLPLVETAPVEPSNIDTLLSEIKKHRLDDVEAENERLKHFLPKIFDKFEVNEPSSALYGKPMPPEMIMCFLRAYEIEETVSATHYVFFHSQVLTTTIFNDFLKETAKLESGCALKNKQVLRDPNSSLSPTLKYFQAHVADYTKRGFNDNKQGRENLIAVSGSLSDRAEFESAASFMIMNTNIDTMLKERLVDYFVRHHKSPSEANVLADKLMKNNLKQSDVGGLYLIMIPKEKVKANLLEDSDEGYLYISESYGIKKTRNELYFTLISDQDVISFLDNKANEQYRILYSGLHNDADARIQLVSTLTKEQRKAARKQVREVAFSARIVK